jgi:hypothetical protein
MIVRWLSCGQNAVICRTVQKSQASSVTAYWPSPGPTPSTDFKEKFPQLDWQLGEQRHRASNFAREIAK